MALASTYAEWIALVRDWLDVDDLTDAQIGTSIQIAQIRLNREMESYEQEKQFSYYQRPAAKVSRHLSDFDSSWFDLMGATVTNTPVSPKIPGIFPSIYTDAWALIEDTSTGLHSWYDNNSYAQSIPAGSTITFSFLVKLQSGSRSLEMNIGNEDFSSGAFITLTSLGVVGASGSYGTVVLIGENADSLGNGWFRIWISVSGFSDSLIESGFNLTQGGSQNYAGDGVSGWLIQHHEIEVQPLSNVDNSSIPSPFVITDWVPDFNKIRLVVPGVGLPPMDVSALNEFQKLLALQKFSTGVLFVTNDNPATGFFTIDANTLSMIPVPVDGAYVTLFYYFEVTPIGPTVDSNVFTQFYPDALLWAACVEASAFIVEDDRAGMYEQKYQNALGVANNKPKRIRLGSTPLRRQITMYAGNQ